MQGIGDDLGLQALDRLLSLRRVSSLLEECGEQWVFRRLRLGAQRDELDTEVEVASDASLGRG